MEPEMRARQTILLNPGAGSVDDAEAFERRLRALPDTEVVRLREPGQATEAAREACAGGSERVVAAGGDGTLHEVLQGIAGHLDAVQLGLLPLGTGNDFARSAGIPADLEGALAILEEGEERRIDVVRLEQEGGNGRLILNASGAGFSALVSDRADGASKEGWGTLAYSIGAMKALPELTAYRLRLQVDEAPVEEVSAWSFVLANGGTIAGGLPIAPGARLDDGLAELLVIPEMPLPSLVAVLPKILLGKHEGDETLYALRGRRFRLEADPPMPLNADGELAGDTPATYEVLPGRLRLLVNSATGCS
jgi:diacylglycerol kinase (ATP)